MTDFRNSDGDVDEKRVNMTETQAKIEDQVYLVSPWRLGVDSEDERYEAVCGCDGTVFRAATRDEAMLKLETYKQGLKLKLG